MRIVLLVLTIQVAIAGCFLHPLSGRKIQIEANVPGVEIYTQPVRYFYEGGAVKNGLTRFGVVPLEMSVAGQGTMEVWAVKDGKMVVVHFDVAQEAPVQIDFSKAVPMNREQSVCLEGKVYVGMPEAYARISWGDPRDVNRTVTRFGAHEQWVYGDRNYLYIDGGKVSSIQN